MDVLVTQWVRRHPERTGEKISHGKSCVRAPSWERTCPFEEIRGGQWDWHMESTVTLNEGSAVQGLPGWGQESGFCLENTVKTLKGFMISFMSSETFCLI